MSNRIDCSVMSHPACVDLPTEAPVARPAAPTESRSTVDTGRVDPQGAAYDCVNDCVSSLGIPAAVASTTVAVACLVASAGGCAVLAGGALGVLLGACAGACDARDVTR